MTERVTPHLDWVSGDMTLMDRHVSFAIVDAPFDRVFPLVAGICRAQVGDVVLREGITDSPRLHLHGNIPHAYFNKFGCINDESWSKVHRYTFPEGCCKEGLLVATPTEAPHLTLLESGGNISLAGITKVDPGLTVYRFRSNIGVRSVQDCVFTVYRNGVTAREVYVANYGNPETDRRGWYIEAEGVPDSIEDLALYRHRSPRKRLNREVLFNYARKLGLDPDRSLFARRFIRSVMIEPLCALSPAEFPEPTRDYEAERQRAIALGIGSREAAFSERGTRWKDERPYIAEDRAADAIEKRLWSRLFNASSPERAAKLLDKYLPEIVRYDHPAHRPFHSIDAAHHRAMKLDPLSEVTIALEARLLAAIPEHFADDPETRDGLIHQIRKARRIAEVRAVERAIRADLKPHLAAAATPDEVLCAADAIYARVEAFREAYKAEIFPPSHIYRLALRRAYQAAEPGPATAELEERLRVHGGEWLVNKTWFETRIKKKNAGKPKPKRRV